MIKIVDQDEIFAADARQLTAAQLALAAEICPLTSASLRAELRQRQDDGQIMDETSHAIRRELHFRSGILQPRAVTAALSELRDRRPRYPYTVSES